MALGVEGVVGGIGGPFIVEGSFAGEGDSVAGAVFGVRRVGNDFGGEEREGDAVPDYAASLGGDFEVVGGVGLGGADAEHVAYADGRFVGHVEVAVPFVGAAGDIGDGRDVGFVAIADDGVFGVVDFGVVEEVDGVVEGVGALGQVGGDDEEGVFEVLEGTGDGGGGVEAANFAADYSVLEVPFAFDDVGGEVGDGGTFANAEGAFVDADLGFGGSVDVD